MHPDNDLATIATFYRRVQWTALAIGVLWVIWLLAPILSPFVFAALLAGSAIRWSTAWSARASSATTR